MKCNSGELYLGNYIDNLKSGYGIYKTSTESYVGNFQNDKRNGFGITFDKRNHLSKVGYWEEDKLIKMDALLKRQKYSNGDMYVGQLVNNERNGIGFYLYKNGDFSIGEWKNGKICGLGIVAQKGVICIGSFKDGLLNGICMIDTLEIGLSIGEFKDGQRNGYGIMDYKNGDRYEGEWKGKYYHGKGIFYDVSGEITEGYYENSIIKETYIVCYKESAVTF